MKIAMLSPIAWRTPPRHYGPWERVTSLLTENLIDLGVDVTLFATADSITRGTLDAVCPAGYEEDPEIEPKVWECLHIANCFEKADRFDLIHNQFDFLPLTYSSLVTTPVLTTIHGFSSPRILPVFRKYNPTGYYVSISNADRAADLDYIATIYHGIDLDQFLFNPRPADNYLLFYGRIHRDKGPAEAIEIAQRCGIRLIMAGIVQDQSYFDAFVAPHLKDHSVEYIGSVGPERRNELLGNALALLHPINFNEPFGLSVVESMACGTPTIAFARGSMPELITDGVDGFLVHTINDAVASVSALDTIHRATCRQTAEQRFSARRMAEEYLRVYRQVLGKKV